MNWQPIETVPKDNNKPIVILVFNDELQKHEPMIGYFDKQYDQLVVIVGDYVSTCFKPVKWLPLPPG